MTLSTVENRDDPPARTWRVGDEDDAAALFAEPPQGVGGFFILDDAVVNDAPDIAEDHVVIVGKFAQAADETRRLDRFWRRIAETSEEFSLTNGKYNHR